MLHINKVKRILRAKNGSQIPKFQNGGSPNEIVLNWAYYLFNPDQYPFGPISYKNRQAIEDLNSILNPHTIGVEIPTDIPDTTNNLNNESIQSPTTQQFQQLTYGDPKLKTSFETLVNESFIDKKQKEYLKMSGFEVPKLTKPVFQDDIDRSVKKAGWREFKTKAGDFISKNAIPIGMGLDYIGGYFDDTINSKGFDTAMGGLDTFGNFASTVDPKMGVYTKLASTLIKGANSLLGKDFNYKIDNNLLARSGASYLGYAAEANRLASKSGKIGFLDFGEHSSLENKKRDLGIDARKISDLLDANDDKLQASRNDLIYTKYNNKVSGLDNKVARFNKQGGKLVDKISLIKSRNLVKQYINSDTLQIEEYAKGGTLDWEPVIEVFEPVIEILEFQKGGQIEENWEPIIEILDDLPEYKSGGKTRTLKELIEYAKQQNPRFIQRLSEDPKGIEFTDDDGNIGIGNVFLEWSTDDAGNAIIYPRIQEMEDKNLKFLSGNEAYKRAVENKNFLMMSPKEADIFFAPDNEYGTAYKRGWPNMFKSSIWKHEQGGKTKSTLETPEIEETTQKNIIPEGALHKNKHHIEHTEGLTKKGIPVVDNDGNQQAEVEKEEIIFSLEVTKKLEELYKDYYNSDKSQKEKDEAAVEAGKLLVYQILFNTDDRTGLIKRCKEGGKL